MSGPIYQTRRNRAVANAIDASLPMIPSVLVGLIAEYSRDRNVAALIKMLASRPDQALVITSPWIGAFVITLRVGSRREYVSLMVDNRGFGYCRFRRVIKMDLDGMVGLLDNQERLAAIIDKLIADVERVVPYRPSPPQDKRGFRLIRLIDDAWTKAHEM